MSPHAYLTELLKNELGSEWRIRHGDRPLDGVLSAPTVVIYTEQIENAQRIADGALTARLAVLVFPKETTPERTENALYEATMAVIEVLREADLTTFWEVAERAVYSDRPAMRLIVTIATERTPNV